MKTLTAPSAAQVAAFGRHMVTAAATATTVLALLKVLSPDQVQAVNGSVTQIGGGVSEIWDGASKIWVGVGPLVAIFSGLWASWTASMKSQITAVNGSDNGVKVVPASSPTPAVTAPLPTPTNSVK